VLDDGEVCDDGNTETEFPPYAAEDCIDDCSLALITCNDGNVDDGEDCDDGNMSSIDACTTSCNANDAAVAAACTRSSGKDEPDITEGTITNCEQVPAVTHLETGCTLSNDFFGQTQVYAAEGDCTPIATKCTSGLCNLAPPNLGNFDGDVTCPAGHTLIEKKVESLATIESKVCVKNCTSDRDCRWNAADEYWEGPGEYRCTTSDLAPDQKYCHDARNDSL